MSLKFIAKIDVTKSKVDPSFYLDRSQIITKKLIDEKHHEKIGAFITASLDLRTLVGALNGRGYSVYPGKSYYLNNLETEEEEFEGHVDDKLPSLIFSIVENIDSEDEWKFVLESLEYQKFRKCALEMKKILGWDIGEYVKVDSDNTAQELSFEAAEDLWNEANKTE